MTINIWPADQTSDKGRPLRLYSPCGCGCDERDGDSRHYLSASDADGNGFTVRLTKAEAVALAKQILSDTR